MPSRNISAKLCELASFSPNETGPTSFANRSDMTYAPMQQKTFRIFYLILAPICRREGKFCPAGSFLSSTSRTCAFLVEEDLVLRLWGRYARGCKGLTPVNEFK